MINQNDNCRIRIGLVHVWNCFKEALTGSGCGDPEMSKKPRRNETRSYNAVDDILLRHMIMPHRGTGNPNMRIQTSHRNKLQLFKSFPLILFNGFYKWDVKQMNVTKSNLYQISNFKLSLQTLW